MLALLRRDAGQLGELRVARGGYKRQRGEERVGGKGERRVAPCAAEGLWKVAREEVAQAVSAFGGVGAIDAAVRADDETVEVVDEPWVAALGSRDGEVGARAPVDAPQLAHLLAVQTPQTGAVEHPQQVLQALPRALALVDETVGRRHVWVLGVGCWWLLKPKPPPPAPNTLQSIIIRR